MPLKERLDGLSEEQRRKVLIELVCAEAASSVGRTGEPFAADEAFFEAEFTSLAAVEMRNRMQDATGLRLPVTLLFDHPTPGILADHLLDKLAAAPAGEDSSQNTEK
ncbi:acyl carrier protein [Streptomyces sp. MAR4 CNX-425]|uniref:acyl carrier protein n=1 Tax=Streptomyces sp. MAR4 CNX-425 TaxID=3406343 RepID=UPI003B504B53